MSSVRLLGRMLLCFGGEGRGIVLRSVAGTGFGVQLFWGNSLRLPQLALVMFLIYLTSVPNTMQSRRMEFICTHEDTVRISFFISNDDSVLMFLSIKAPLQNTCTTCSL
jgi:hypothetical protein